MAYPRWPSREGHDRCTPELGSDGTAVAGPAFHVTRLQIVRDLLDEPPDDRQLVQPSGTEPAVPLNLRCRPRKPELSAGLKTERVGIVRPITQVDRLEEGGPGRVASMGQARRRVVETVRRTTCRPGGRSNPVVIATGSHGGKSS